MIPENFILSPSNQLHNYRKPSEIALDIPGHHEESALLNLLLPLLQFMHRIGFCADSFTYDTRVGGVKLVAGSRLSKVCLETSSFEFCA